MFGYVQISGMQAEYILGTHCDTDLIIVATRAHGKEVEGKGHMLCSCLNEEKKKQKAKCRFNKSQKQEAIYKTIG